jgi:hypothetical protein
MVEEGASVIVGDQYDMGSVCRDVCDMVREETDAGVEVVGVRAGKEVTGIPLGSVAVVDTVRENRVRCTLYADTDEGVPVEPYGYVQMELAEAAMPSEREYEIFER